MEQKHFWSQGYNQTSGWRYLKNTTTNTGIPSNTSANRILSIFSLFFHIVLTPLHLFFVPATRATQNECQR